KRARYRRMCPTPGRSRMVSSPSGTMLLSCRLFSLAMRRTPSSTLFPYTTLFRSTPSTRCERPARRSKPSGSGGGRPRCAPWSSRSEEHTSELQSRGHLVCRLLLEKKNPSPVPLLDLLGFLLDSREVLDSESRHYR